MLFPLSKLSFCAGIYERNFSVETGAAPRPRHKLVTRIQLFSPKTKCYPYDVKHISVQIAPESFAS